MTILTAIQEACLALALSKPLTALDDDPTAMRLLGFAHEAGDDIAKRGDWRRMLETTSAAAGPIALPADFERLVPGGAVNIILPSPSPVRGPLSSDQMAAISSGRFGATAACYYTMRGSTIVLSRALSGETVSVDWVRRQWITDDTGTVYRLRAAADADVLLFPDRLLTKGVIWRFKRETGLQYQDEMAEWEADLAMHLRQDRGVTA